jgi:hypothetical protein
MIGATFESSSSSYTGDAGNNANMYEVGTCATSPTYSATEASGTASVTDDVLDNDSI